MSREVPQPTNQRYARIQKRRSESVRRGRGLRRCRTSSVAGGKDCLRSATALAASRQQRPTANSETLTSPPGVEPPGGRCCSMSSMRKSLQILPLRLERRRQTTALAASRQQRPTANSETLTSPACCRTSREADVAQRRQGKGCPDHNFAPYS